MFIYSLSKPCLEHAKAIFYNLQKDLSNNVFHASIKVHLTLILNGFVLENQISNFDSQLFFLS